MPVNSRRSSNHGRPAKLGFYRNMHVRITSDIILAMDNRLSQWDSNDKSYNDIMLNALRAYLGIDGDVEPNNDQSNESFNPLA